MSTNIPDFDPYTVLGVDKDAPNSAIKAAYRKLVLKWHPDKIQDESLRTTAVNEFQKVQTSYEILSDEGRRQLYDQEIYLNKLRKETAAQKAYASREYRDGQMYEERVPAGAFFSSSDEHLYTDEPISYSHKYADSPKRSHTKATEERKKAKGPSVYTYSTARPAKQSDRDHVKAAHYDRARTRTKERRRDASDKYERTATGFDSESDDAYSDVEREHLSYRTKVESDVRYSSPRESVPPRRKTDASYSSKHHRSRGSSTGSDSEDDHDDYPSYSTSKLDGQEEWAKKYIGRTTDPVIRPHTSSRHPGYEDRERRHSETPRYSTRSSHSHKESVHVETSSPRSNRRSHERLDSAERGDRSYEYDRAYERERERDRDRRRDREFDLDQLDREIDRRERERERGRTVPSLSTTASQKVPSSPRAPPTITRSATAPYPRSRREGSSRSESKGPLAGLVNGLASMVVDGFAGDTKVSSRSSTGRGVSRSRGVSRPRGTERNDSGYSSGPSTPEMPQNAAAKIKQYKIVETGDKTRLESVDAYPPPSSSRSERARDRSTAPRPKTTTRTKTYAFEPEIITRQPASVSSKTSSSGRQHLYGEIPLDGHRYTTRPTVA